MYSHAALPANPAFVGLPALSRFGDTVLAGVGSLNALVGRSAASAVLAVALLGSTPVVAQDATNPQACEPGGYWYIWRDGASNTVPMACPDNASPAASAGASFEPLPTRPRASVRQATNPQDCEAGDYWYIPTEEAPWTSTPMKCR